MTDETTIDLDEVQLDLDREKRCGFPEVIYGEGKTADTIIKTIRTQLERNICSLATRVDNEKAVWVGDAVRQILRDKNQTGLTIRHNSVGRTLRVVSESNEKKGIGKIAILSAGTTDAPVAEEAKETALWTGAEVVCFQDVGVAGPHRLQAKLPFLQDADVVIVIAGMEGALPSVVGGYVACPVIAVPTSVGYGASFGGLAALLGMLNSCASNVTVVNIDAGFKAAYVAGLILKRIRAR